MTSKRQVTLPKALADEYGIRPGDEIDWEPAGDAIRVLVRGRTRPLLSVEERLDLFDEATRRRDELLCALGPVEQRPEGRGWTREELYDRGRPR